jgi:hypothetical protein
VRVKQKVLESRRKHAMTDGCGQCYHAASVRRSMKKYVTMRSSELEGCKLTRRIKAQEEEGTTSYMTTSSMSSRSRGWQGGAGLQRWGYDNENDNGANRCKLRVLLLGTYNPKEW